MVIVTPFLAKPVARDELSRPDDGFESASDLEAILLGRLNKTDAAAPAPSDAYRGSYGFIID